MESIANIGLNHFSTLKSSLTVNSNKTVNSNNNTLTTVNGIDDWLEKCGTSRDGVANKLAEDLGDSRSIKYYQALTHNHDPRRLLDALAIVKSAKESGKIIKHAPVYFQGILKNWGLKTKFSIR